MHFRKFNLLFCQELIFSCVCVVYTTYIEDRSTKRYFLSMRNEGMNINIRRYRDYHKKELKSTERRG